MKKNDFLLLVAVTVYSFLFYLQSAGVNYFIFGILLTVFQLVQNHEIIKKPAWLMAAAGLLASSTGLLVYGNLLSHISFILSVLVCAFTSFSPKSSFFAGLFYSLASFVSSWTELLLEKAKPLAEGEKPVKQKSSVWIWLIPVLLALVFFFLYRSSNAVFYELTKEISLDFLTPGWVFFTLFGWIWLRGFFRFPFFLEGLKKETLLPDSVDRQTEFKSALNKWLTEDTEYKAGVASFVLLNLVLLSVNVIDFVYVLGGAQLPGGLTHSEFVHQGIGALIAALVCAILLVLYFFRGRVYLHPAFRTIAFFAVLWIVQNILMVGFNVVKNYNYIDEHGLTYKRIGVYVYLLLTTIGLMIAAYKVYRRKTNWFLFRKTGWAFYLVMIISTFFHWSKMISDHNIAAYKKGKLIDVEYLYQLGNYNLPDLVKNNFILTSRDYDNYRSVHYVYNAHLYRRIYDFIDQWNNSDWRSWNFEKQRIYDELKQLHEEGYLRDIDFSYTKISDIDPVTAFDKVKWLDLSGNEIESITGIEKLKELSFLNLSENPVYNFSPLKSLPQLETLQLSWSNGEYFEWLSQLKKPKHLILVGEGNPEWLRNKFPQLRIDVIYG